MLYQSVLFLALLFSSLNAYETQVAFDDTEEIYCDEYEEDSERSIPRAPRYNPEEEKLYEERTESHWPGKREDTILEQMTHY